jgi:dihydrofolate reductase
MDSEPETDFGAFTGDFDTLLMGRATYLIAKQGPGASMPGMRTLVCSRTLPSEEHPEVTVVNDAAATVEKLKSEPGKDIWLFGGGGLFRSLLDARLVDRIELAVMPILLGQGIPLLPEGARSPRLHLEETQSTPSGGVNLRYTVLNRNG